MFILHGPYLAGCQIAGFFPQLRPHAPAPCEDPRPAKPYEDGKSGYVDNYGLVLLYWYYYNGTIIWLYPSEDYIGTIIMVDMW